MGWLTAVRGEAEHIPSRVVRWRWLAGGAWAIACHSAAVRRAVSAVAAVAAGTVVVALAWHPGSTNPAVPVERAGLIGTTALLAVLPWVLRPILGPVAANGTAPLARRFGYLSVYLLLLVIALLSRFAGSRFDQFEAFDPGAWRAEMRADAWVSVLLLAGLVGGYAVLVLALTARRSAVPPRVLALATGLGAAAAVVLYALMPFGNARHLPSSGLQTAYQVVLIAVPIAALVAVGPVAGRRLSAGVVGGLGAGATAALVLTVLTVATMLLFPDRVDLEWANPSPLVPHGTPYEIRMSVGDAAIKYYVALIAGPIVGLVLGTVSGVMAKIRPR
jgi:hypothetical protein